MPAMTPAAPRLTTVDASKEAGADAVPSRPNPATPPLAKRAGVDAETPCGGQDASACGPPIKRKQK